MRMSISLVSHTHTACGQELLGHMTWANIKRAGDSILQYCKCSKGFQTRETPIINIQELTPQSWVNWVCSTHWPTVCKQQTHNKWIGHRATFLSQDQINIWSKYRIHAYIQFCQSIFLLASLLVLKSLVLLVVCSTLCSLFLQVQSSYPFLADCQL